MDFEEQKVPDSILDKYTKVCTCRSISRKTIKEAINDGCDTIPKIRERTGAGTGSCGGKNCGVRIVKLLQDMANYQNRAQKKMSNSLSKTQTHNSI